MTVVEGLVRPNTSMPVARCAAMRVKPKSRTISSRSAPVFESMS
jgi:hypothetical protein